MKEEVGLCHATLVDARMPMITIEVVGHRVIDTFVDGGSRINMITNSFCVQIGLQGM